jgi:hypothetical protein
LIFQITSGITKDLKYVAIVVVVIVGIVVGV